MPVHVFGFPCDVEAIDALAKKHGLPVIYDAAHAFGVQYKGKSLFSYGDISIASFHATKLFHTIEGGGIVSASTQVHDKIELMKRFGHDYDDHMMLGINAKASEFQAAMGLCNLRHVDENIAKRKKVFEQYDALLKPALYRPKRDNPDLTYNYAYYPVVLESERALLDTMERLAEHKIFPRRYFYPSLNQLPYITTTNPCPNSEDISRRILCLPLYGDLEESVIAKVAEVLTT